jgi:hypothetical protein
LKVSSLEVDPKVDTTRDLSKYMIINDCDEFVTEKTPPNQPGRSNHPFSHAPLTNRHKDVMARSVSPANPLGFGMLIAK